MNSNQWNEKDLRKKKKRQEELKKEQEEKQRIEEEKRKTEEATLNIRIIQEAELKLPTSKLWAMLQNRTAERKVKLKKVHNSDYVAPHSLLDKNCDVTLYVKAKPERLEWSGLKLELEKLRGGKPIILIFMELTSDKSHKAKVLPLVQEPNVFVLLVDQNKKILHPISTYEQAQEQALIDYLLDDKNRIGREERL